MKQKIGMIGLGRMGMAMAERFLETGLQVIGTDISNEMLKVAKEKGIETVDTAEKVYANADIVLLSLPTANDVKVAVSSLIKKRPTKELYIIDTTSSDPVVTKDLEQKLEPLGVHFIDAPVSGGFFGARAGTLGIMVGGREEYLTNVRHVLDKIGGNVVYMGSSGNGHATKLLNNLLGAANLLIASEMVKLGVHLGLDPEKLITVINSGSAKNSATEISFPRWILSKKFDSGFTMRLMRKDIALAGQLVANRGSLPLMSKVSEIWAKSGPSIPDNDDFNKITEFHPSQT